MMWKGGDSGCCWLWVSVTLLQQSLVSQASAGMGYLVPLVLAGRNLAHRSLPKLGLQLMAPRYPVPTHSMTSTCCQQYSNALKP